MLWGVESRGAESRARGGVWVRGYVPCGRSRMFDRITLGLTTSCLLLQGSETPLIRNVFVLDTCEPIVGADVLSFATYVGAAMSCTHTIRPDAAIITPPLDVCVVALGHGSYLPLFLVFRMAFACWFAGKVSC